MTRARRNAGIPWWSLVFAFLIGTRLGSRATASPSPAAPPVDVSRTARSDAPHLSIAQFLQYSSVSLGILLLVKAYGVAHFSLTTTGDLVTTAPVATLLGTLASYEYVALPLTAVVLAGWLWTNRRSETQMRPIAFFALVVFVFLSPWVYLWPIACLALPFLALRRLLDRWDVGLPVARAFVARPLAYYAACVAAAFLLWTIDKPWVPAEVVVARSPILVRPLGHQRDRAPIIYVLSDSGASIVGITADTRYVLHIPAENVVGRIVCHESSQLPGHRPILSVLEGHDYKSPNLSCQHARDDVQNGRLSP